MVLERFFSGKNKPSEESSPSSELPGTLNELPSLKKLGAALPFALALIGNAPKQAQAQYPERPSVIRVENSPEVIIRHPSIRKYYIRSEGDVFESLDGMDIRVGNPNINISREVIQAAMRRLVEKEGYSFHSLKGADRQALIDENFSEIQKVPKNYTLIKFQKISVVESNNDRDTGGHISAGGQEAQIDQLRSRETISITAYGVVKVLGTTINEDNEEETGVLETRGFKLFAQARGDTATSSGFNVHGNIPLGKGQTLPFSFHYDDRSQGNSDEKIGASPLDAAEEGIGEALLRYMKSQGWGPDIPVYIHHPEESKSGAWNAQGVDGIRRRQPDEVIHAPRKYAQPGQQTKPDIVITPDDENHG